MAHPHWPLFDLEVRTPRLVLRYLDDELGKELATLASRGIHDPAWMPFAVPWTDRPSPELERQAYRHWWRCRAETTPASWIVNLVALRGDEVIGTSTLGANDFGVLRTFGTGSWLGRSHQGQGLGTEMREATLHLGFAGLGAVFATTDAFVDNAPSLGVTRHLGYEQIGERRMVRRDEPGVIHEFRMSREHWETIRRDDITLHGVDGARELLEIT